MKKATVTVYGIKNETPASSGCGCGPALSMGEMYEEFLANMSRTELIDNTEINFVDIGQRDLDQYPQIKEALENGYALPLTEVNDQIRFQSSIPFNHVFSLVKRSLK